MLVRALLDPVLVPLALYAGDEAVIAGEVALLAAFVAQIAHTFRRVVRVRQWSPSQLAAVGTVARGQLDLVALDAGTEVVLLAHECAPVVRMVANRTPGLGGEGQISAAGAAENDPIPVVVADLAGSPSADGARHGVGFGSAEVRAEHESLVVLLDDVQGESRLTGRADFPGTCSHPLDLVASWAQLIDCLFQHLCAVWLFCFILILN